MKIKILLLIFILTSIPAKEINIKKNENIYKKQISEYIKNQNKYLPFKYTKLIEKEKEEQNNLKIIKKYKFLDNYRNSFQKLYLLSYIFQDIKSDCLDVNGRFIKQISNGYTYKGITNEGKEIISIKTKECNDYEMKEKTNIDKYLKDLTEEEKNYFKYEYFSIYKNGKIEKEILFSENDIKIEFETNEKLKKKELVNYFCSSFINKIFLSIKKEIIINNKEEKLKIKKEDCKNIKVNINNI